MRNLKGDVKEIRSVVVVFLVVFGLVILIGWLIKLLFK